MTNTQNNIEQLVNDIRIVLKSHPVKKASLFGSYARGDNRKDSDIDILVELEKGQSLLDLVGIEQDLEENLNKKFDVITYNSINPHIKESILKYQMKIL